MHCPSCNRTLAAGTKCPKCGKGAVASSVDEIDLMPLEEPKVAGAAAFEPPPEAFLPPPTMPGKGKKKGLAEPSEEPERMEPLRVRAGALAPKASNTNRIIGGAVLLLLLLFISWRIFRTESKIIGPDPSFETKTFTIQPNQALVRNVEISGSIRWSFDVTATDDTVAVAVVQRSGKDPQTVAALRKLPEPYEPVKKGESHSMSGEFKTGTYSWVVLNENKKAVRVKVKFKAQP